MPFVVIERDPDRVQPGDRATAGSRSRPTRAAKRCCKRVGIHRARGLIAAVGTDAENVFTVLTARVMRPDLFIIARVESDDAEHKLRRAGADRVISPYQIGATHMVQTALRPAVVDFVQLATSSEQLDLSMEQVHIRTDSALAGRSIVDAGIRQKFGVIIVGIKRGGGHDGVQSRRRRPSMRAGDELVVLGRPRASRRWRRGVVRMSARVLDGQALASGDAGRDRAGGARRSPRSTAGRRASASCSSATTRRPRSTSATS